MHADHDTRRRYEHDVEIVAYELHVHKSARFVVKHARFDPHAGASLPTVILGIGAFAVTVFGNGENVVPFLQDKHIDDVLAFAEVHRLHAHGIAPHRTHVAFRKADTLARTARHDNIVAAARKLHGNEFVAVRDLDCNFTAAHDARKFARRRLFNQTIFGRHDEIPFAVFAYGQDRRHLFPCRQLNNIDDRSAARRTVRLGDLVSFHRIHLAEIREEQNGAVGVAHEHVLDKVVLFGFMPRNTHAAAVLHAVFGNGETLDVSAVRHGNHNVLFVDQIGVLDIAVIDGNLRFTGRRIFAADRKQVGADDRHNAAFVRQNVF